MNKRVGVISLIVGALSCITCFSIGFGDWIINSKDLEVSGSITTDDHTSSYVSKNEYITINNATDIGYRNGRGFNDLSTGEYKDNIDITINGTFHKKNAIDDGAIQSLIDDGSMSLKITIAFDPNPTILTSFTVADIPVTSSGFSNVTVLKDLVKTSTYVTKRWNVGHLYNANDIPFTVKFNLKFIGTITYFPNLTTNKIKVSILPGEYNDLYA